MLFRSGTPLCLKLELDACFWHSAAEQERGETTNFTHWSTLQWYVMMMLKRYLQDYIIAATPIQVKPINHERIIGYS